MEISLCADQATMNRGPEGSPMTHASSLHDVSVANLEHLKKVFPSSSAKELAGPELANPNDIEERRSPFQIVEMCKQQTVTAICTVRPKFDDLDFWADSLTLFASAMPLGGVKANIEAQQSPRSDSSVMFGDSECISFPQKRDVEVVAACKTLLRELQSHDLLSQQLHSYPPLHFRSYVQVLVSVLLDRLVNASPSSYSTGWGLRQDFVSRLSASVESKDVPALFAKHLARAFDELYHRFVPYEMGIHPPIRQFDHGPQWVGKPILVYIRDEQTIRSFLKARIVEYSEEDSSYQIMYEDEMCEWISLPSHDIAIDTGDEEPLSDATERPPLSCDIEVLPCLAIRQPNPDDLDSRPMKKPRARQRAAETKRTQRPGRWTEEEHERFLALMERYNGGFGLDNASGSPFRTGILQKVAAGLGNRTVAQVSSHAQYHLLRLRKAAAFLPPQTSAPDRSTAMPNTSLYPGPSLAPAGSPAPPAASPLACVPAGMLGKTDLRRPAAKQEDINCTRFQPVDNLKYLGKNLLKSFVGCSLLGQVVSVHRHSGESCQWDVVFEDGHSESMNERDLKASMRKLQYKEQTPSVVRLQKLEKKVMEWKSKALEPEISKSQAASPARNGDGLGSSQGARPDRQSQGWLSTKVSNPNTPDALASAAADTLARDVLQTSLLDPAALANRTPPSSRTSIASDVSAAEQPALSLAVVLQQRAEQQPSPAITMLSEKALAQPAAGTGVLVQTENGSRAREGRSLSMWENHLHLRESRMLAREAQLDKLEDTLRERMLAREDHLDAREQRLMERERMLEEREARFDASDPAQENDRRKVMLDDLQMQEVNTAMAKKEAELAEMQRTKRKLEQELCGTDGLESGGVRKKQAIVWHNGSNQ